MTGTMLNVTGTRDQGAGGQDWHWKSEPFHLAPPGGKYNAVLEGGNHYLGGIAGKATNDTIPAQLHAVQHLTLAFLDAELLGDHEAENWLSGISDKIGDAPVLFERK